MNYIYLLYKNIDTCYYLCVCSWANLITFYVAFQCMKVLHSCTKSMIGYIVLWKMILILLHCCVTSISSFSGCFLSVSIICEGVACRFENIISCHHSGWDNEVFLKEICWGTQSFFRIALDACYVVTLYSTHDLCSYINEWLW